MLLSPQSHRRMRAAYGFTDFVNIGVERSLQLSDQASSLAIKSGRQFAPAPICFLGPGAPIAWPPLHRASSNRRQPAQWVRSNLIFFSLILSIEQHRREQACPREADDLTH
jgi:hypothetical protein